MRVLVTGATGFVGGHLLPPLAAVGHSVSIGLRKAESACQLAPTLRTAARTIVVGEVDAYTDWRQALEGVDAVIHLAAHAHQLGRGADDEAAFLRVNADGTARLVEQSMEAGVGRFILMSSIGAVTSACDARITIETQCEPETAYGRSKLAGERALKERAKGTPMAWTILRPTLVYGPGNPGNMERLISLVRRGVPLPLGAIRNRRSLTYVGNLVSVTLAALAHPGADNSTFLVADGQDVSTPELVRRIAALAESRTRVVSVPLPLLRGLARGADALSALTTMSLPFDTATLQRLQSSLYVDVEPLRVTLGWTPPFSLDQGLRCMLTPS